MIVLGLSLIAAAAPSASAPPPIVVMTNASVDPARMEAALAFLDAQNFEQQSLEFADTGFEAIMASVASRLIERYGDEIPEGFLAKFRTTMHDHFIATM